MLRRLAVLGVVPLGVLCLALGPHQAPPGARPAPALVPTAQRVISTAPAPGLTPPVAPEPTPAPPSSVERARQGVVVLERQGKPLALGSVLEGDGRILTALSPLGTGNFLSARYADGVVVPVKVVHGDRGWDLALLAAGSTPKQPLRKAGLRAARAPSFIALQSFALTPPNTIAALPVALTLAPSLLGGDAAWLGGAYELSPKPALVGGPVVNATGEVVGLVARACPAGQTTQCVPAPYGVPVSQLKLFLKRVPAEAAWLGIEGAGETGVVRGVRVVSVAPASPAALAGLRPGADVARADVVVAVDGLPVATPIELNEALRAHGPGDTIELLLFGLGRYRQVPIKPRPAADLTTPGHSTPAADDARLLVPYP